MQPDFSRIISLLRKEKGITQKKAAADLGISQALLSHYEKGIRECGLEFVVKVANYYDVSCDYLLGRSPDRQGLTLSVDDIPDADTGGKENMVKGQGSILPVLNKKLISNSLNVLFDLLAKSQNKGLTNEMSSYLMVSVYKMFRLLYSANQKNQSNLFSVPGIVYKNYSDAALNLHEARAEALLNGYPIEEQEAVKNTDIFEMTGQSISQKYPLFSSSLFNLIQNAESKMEK